MVKIKHLKIYSKPVNVKIKSSHNNQIIDHRIIDIYQGATNWAFSTRNFYNCLTDYNVAECQKKEEKKSIISYMTFIMGGSTADEIMYNRTFRGSEDDFNLFNLSFNKLEVKNLTENQSLISLKNELKEKAKNNINNNNSKFNKLIKTWKILENVTSSEIDYIFEYDDFPHQVKSIMNSQLKKQPTTNKQKPNWLIN